GKPCDCSKSSGCDRDEPSVSCSTRTKRMDCAAVTLIATHIEPKSRSTFSRSNPTPASTNLKVSGLLQPRLFKHGRTCWRLRSYYPELAPIKLRKTAAERTLGQSCVKASSAPAWTSTAHTTSTFTTRPPTRWTK